MNLQKAIVVGRSNPACGVRSVFGETMALEHGLILGEFEAAFKFKNLQTKSICAGLGMGCDGTQAVALQIRIDGEFAEVNATRLWSQSYLGLR